MATSEDDVCVRKATLSDFRCVLGISGGLHFGWDYLQHYYHVYLQDKRSNCFVATVHGKVVSFTVHAKVVSFTVYTWKSGKLHSLYMENGKFHNR